jgi:hypothetical protein
MKKFFPLVLVLLSFSVFGQNNVVKEYADQITEKDLKDNLSIIASDAMEGRETGKRGQKMAAAFIASTFHDLGLQAPVNGSHYQKVPLILTGAPTATLMAGKNVIPSDQFAFYDGNEASALIDMPIVFVGKGSEEEIKNINIKGKAVLVLAGSGFTMRNAKVIDQLKEKGAKLVLLVMEIADEFNRSAGRIKRGGRLILKNDQSRAAIFIALPQITTLLFNDSYENLNKVAPGKLKEIKPANINYSVATNGTEVESENILGFLEGTDKKDEVVVVTAHYDHIGISANAEGDKINNGADDDGSGTVSVLQLAKVFAQAKKDGKGPRRSILFMTVTGEEKGLLGSEYYSDHPVYPLEKTVVDLNIDMVGRRDPQHKESPPYVYVVGSNRLSADLHSLSENINKANLNLVFDYLYNAEDHPDRIYYRSDHWNFAKKNVPIIFYFDGVHEDYHKPSDEIGKIEFDLLVKRAQTVFYTAWEIANRENRLVVDKK